MTTENNDQIINTNPIINLLKEHWKYNIPTPEDAKKYKIINDVAARAHNVSGTIQSLASIEGGADIIKNDLKVVFDDISTSMFDDISTSTINLALAINEQCPNCCDKDEAIKQCRIAHMAMNAAANAASVSTDSTGAVDMYILLAEFALIQAMFFANASIALDGKF